MKNPTMREFRPRLMEDRDKIPQEIEDLLSEEGLANAPHINLEPLVTKLLKASNKEEAFGIFSEGVPSYLSDLQKFRPETTLDETQKMLLMAIAEICKTLAAENLKPAEDCLRVSDWMLDYARTVVVASKGVN